MASDDELQGMADDQKLLVLRMALQRFAVTQSPEDLDRLRQAYDALPSDTEK